MILVVALPNAMIGQKAMVRQGLPNLKKINRVNLKFDFNLSKVCGIIY